MARHHNIQKTLDKIAARDVTLERAPVVMDVEDAPYVEPIAAEPAPPPVPKMSDRTRIELERGRARLKEVRVQSQPKVNPDGIRDQA